MPPKKQPKIKDNAPGSPEKEQDNPTPRGSDPSGVPPSRRCSRLEREPTPEAPGRDGMNKIPPSEQRIRRCRMTRSPPFDPEESRERRVEGERIRQRVRGYEPTPEEIGEADKISPRYREDWRRSHGLSDTEVRERRRWAQLKRKEIHPNGRDGMDRSPDSPKLRRRVRSRSPPIDSGESRKRGALEISLRGTVVQSSGSNSKEDAPKRDEALSDVLEEAEEEKPVIRRNHKRRNEPFFFEGGLDCYALWKQKRYLAGLERVENDKSDVAIIAGFGPAFPLRRRIPITPPPEIEDREEEEKDDDEEDEELRKKRMQDAQRNEIEREFNENKKRVDAIRMEVAEIEKSERELEDFENSVRKRKEELAQRKNRVRQENDDLRSRNEVLFTSLCKLFPSDKDEVLQ